MGIYIDTSCLLKLFFPEPESARIYKLVAIEKLVVVSSLTRLETIVRIQARYTANLLSKSDVIELLHAVNSTIQADPFEVRACSALLMEEAERQLYPIPSSTYCRTLDRLHLGIVTTSGLKRLLTNDDVQAHAAKAMGLRVIMPR